MFVSNTMFAAELRAPQFIELARRETPRRPNRGEVELRVGYVGVCGFDQLAFTGRASLCQMPVVLGHEFSAQVITCGPGVTGYESGQWVSVAPLLTCMDCTLCNTGNEHLCSQRTIFGAQVDGALCERLIMPAQAVFPLSESVSPQAGALTEPLAVAVHAVEQIPHFVTGQNVVISGAGAIGLLIASVCIHRRARSVQLLEVDSRRQNFAQQLGFDVVCPQDAQTDFANCLFIATGAPEALARIPALLAPRGWAVVVGTFDEHPLHWMDLLMKEGTVTTSRYFTLADFNQAVRLMAENAINPGTLIQDQVNFADLFINNGQHVMDRAQQVVRLLIDLTDMPS